MAASDDGESSATVPSRDAVARSLPQGENRTHETARLCGVAARTCRYGLYGGGGGGACCCCAPDDMVGGALSPTGKKRRGKA
ncbi:hypothetical protein E2562_008950 [Oryza meyeriana var. granulata]|uniref:Uncharacterized protein n=1 Tax=Oryza meyeriana var. granulata TaxID=110450 RepID=A0A6G1D2F8_9ORYZ|nr:hypothetical protein E2562_008950 [Oryza meyeriana var. granulata]